MTKLEKIILAVEELADEEPNPELADVLDEAVDILKKVQEEKK